VKFLKVLTFNLRLDREEDGINYFFNRTDRIFDVIHSENPDIIGFQEVTDRMKAFLCENISEYTLVGCGRNSDYHGEGVPVAYKNESISLISSENLWLSPTPEIPGSTYGGDQSRCPRMFTSCLFKHKEYENLFRFINTHFDHYGVNARCAEANQIAEKIETFDEKFILTGDINALPDTDEVRIITEKLNHRGVSDVTNGLGGTYHGYGTLGDRAVKIDYIFTNAECTSSYIVPDTHKDGIYYSDHYAVAAIIEM